MTYIEKNTQHHRGSVHLTSALEQSSAKMKAVFKETTTFALAVRIH